MGTPRTGNTGSTGARLDDYWPIRALCRGKWGLFDAADTVDGGSKQFYPHLTQAQALCSVCPVARQCEIAGEDEPTGIWSGEPKGV